MYTLNELNEMTTLSQSQFDNLKLDYAGVRVWLSRMTTSDGMPYDNQVTEESLVDGIWTTHTQYEAQ